jgi:deoxyadenosine/deoxycytidine kinase
MNCLNSLDEQVCNIRKTEKKHKGNIVFIERDIVAVSIFTKTAYACKYINDLEYNLFEKYYKYTTGVPDLRFTIDTPISECLKRIKKRKRTGEETIDKSYLHELYNQYRKVESNVFFNGLNCPDHIALDIEDYV